jgi:hypothetical protein
MVVARFIRSCPRFSTDEIVRRAALYEIHLKGRNLLPVSLARSGAQAWSGIVIFESSLHHALVVLLQVPADIQCGSYPMGIRTRTRYKALIVVSIVSAPPRWL